MTKRKASALVIFVFAATLVLAACGDATPTPGVGASPAATTALTAPAITTAAPTTQSSPATTAAPATTAGVTTAAPATTSAPTTGPASTAAATISGTTSAAGSDLTLPNKDGSTVTLTKKPERIVCLFSSCVDNLAELGITPVGVDKIDGLVVTYPHFFGDKGKNIRVLSGNGYDVNIEDIASLKPDLVVGFAGPMDGLRASLKDIAPLWLVYPQSYQEALDVFRAMGRVTGRGGQAETAIANFQAKLAAYKAKSPKDKAFMVGIYDGKTFYPYVQGSILCGLLGEVANCPWKAEQATGTGVVPYSTEQLLKADPEVLFIINFPGAPNKLTDSIKTDPVGKELKAVKNGQLYDASLWYQSYGTRSLSFVLDDAMAKMYPQVFPAPLTAAAGGAATTEDLTITDTTGAKITLAKRPERIFCISATCMDWLAELKMQPVGITSLLQPNVGVNWLFGAKGQSIPVVGGNTLEPNLEDIAKLKPDLVIGYAGYNENLTEALKPIAPLANFSAHNLNEALAQFKAFSKLVGKSSQADTTSQKVLGRLAAYQAKSPKTKSVALLAYTDEKNIFVKTNQTLQCAILAQLSRCDWTLPQNAGPYGSFGIAQFSIEEMLKADPDYIFGYGYVGSPTLADIFKNNSIWQSLKAAKNSRVLNVDGFLWGDGNGPRAINLFMDDAMTKLYPEVFSAPLP